MLKLAANGSLVVKHLLGRFRGCRQVRRGLQIKAIVIAPNKGHPRLYRHLAQNQHRSSRRCQNHRRSSRSSGSCGQFPQVRLASRALVVPHIMLQNIGVLKTILGMQDIGAILSKAPRLLTLSLALFELFENNVTDLLRIAQPPSGALDRE